MAFPTGGHGARVSVRGQSSHKILQTRSSWVVVCCIPRPLSARCHLRVHPSPMNVPAARRCPGRVKSSSFPRCPLAAYDLRLICICSITAGQLAQLKVPHRQDPNPIRPPDRLPSKRPQQYPVRSCLVHPRPWSRLAPLPSLAPPRMR